MRSISSSNLSLIGPTVFVLSFQDLSLLTDTIPFLSMSNVTSICGIPRGSAGYLSKRPEMLVTSLPLGLPRERGYQRLVDLSAAVEDLWFYCEDTTIVSIPDNGVTSRRTTSFTSDHTTLDRSTHNRYFVRFTDLFGSFTSFSFNGFYNGRDTRLNHRQGWHRRYLTSQACITERACGVFVRSGHEVKSSNFTFESSHFQVKRVSSSCSDEWQADWLKSWRSFFAFR